MKRKSLDEIIPNSLQILFYVDLVFFISPKLRDEYVFIRIRNLLREQK